jgi:hypothetical protein
MIFRLYFLFFLKKGLLELLVLSFCSFCTSNCNIGLGTQGSEFLFQKRFRVIWIQLVTRYWLATCLLDLFHEDDDGVDGNRDN